LAGPADAAAVREVAAPPLPLLWRAAHRCICAVALLPRRPWASQDSLIQVKPQRQLQSKLKAMRWREERCGLPAPLGDGAARRHAIDTSAEY